MNRFFKYISTIFITLAAITLVVILAVPAYRQELIKTFLYSKCDAPTTYKIGTIDSKFGQTQSEMLTDLQSAANIWNNSYGKNLFEYSKTAKLTINFTYDQRSSLYTSINDLQNQLDQKNLSYEQQVAEHEANVAAFNKQLSDYNNTVEQYNKKGGAPADVYNELMAQQKQLQDEADALSEEAKKLNVTADNYNIDVQKLNKNITEFNSEISQKPEEGLYNPNNDTITIFFITSQEELIHTLTHELGHSLSLPHVSNPKSIMYPYTSKFLNLTSQDMEQLTLACAEQSIFEHWIEVFTERYMSVVGPTLNNYVK